MQASLGENLLQSAKDFHLKLWIIFYTGQQHAVKSRDAAKALKSIVKKNTVSQIAVYWLQSFDFIRKKKKI